MTVIFLKKTTDSEWIIDNKYIYKKWKDSVPAAVDDLKSLRLKLENERQEILGKLSFLTAQDKDYATLDRKFNALTKRINELLN